MEKRLARREKSRVLWIDGVRFLAFGVVFTRHYFESFFPENTGGSWWNKRISLAWNYG